MAKLAPPYSSHVCLGGWDAGADADGRADLGSVDAPWARLVRNQKERTCLFRNVCFDGKSSGSGSVGWTYYAQPHEFTGARRFRAGVDIWARGDFARMGEVSEDHTFALLRSAVPEHASWLPTHTVVKLAPLAPSNFGHFLGNALYPAFVAAWRMFGETTKALPLQLLLVGPNQTDPRSMRARCLRWAQHQQLADNRRRRRYQPQLPKPRLALDAQAQARCQSQAALTAKFATELLPGLSAAPLLWEGELPAEARRRSGGLICARRLLVGTGDLGFSTVYWLRNGTRRRPPMALWDTFISHLLQRLDLVHGADVFSAQAPSE